MTKKLTPLTPDRDQILLDRQRLVSLMNSMADGVIAVDEDVKIVTYNAAALNLLDRNTIKAGTLLSTVFSPIDKNNQPVNIIDIVKQTSIPTTSRDYKLKYSDESTINLYSSIAPVRLSYGVKGNKGYVILIRDITREKSLEEERDEFISVVSHELRTPIAISEGNISNAMIIAEKTGDIKAVQEALKEAHSQILFLADMINDLATLSRAERGKLNVEIESINMVELVNELASNYTPEIKQKGLKLNLHIDPKLELLKSSRLYVREILQNFITNSIKYTWEGSISIAAKHDPKGVIVEISDTGIGISKGDQERVFDKFFRSEDYRTRQSKGTGLGLYVTMKLTRLIHAEIDLKSELNHGSTFTIFIPNLK